MNVEETIKHLGNHWELYCLAGDGEYSFDDAKKYLMDECGKPESTARAKINSFKYTKNSVLKISYDGKRFSIDSDKVDELEASIDEVIHFTEFDYRYRNLKEWMDFCDEQTESVSLWLDSYQKASDEKEALEIRFRTERIELRSKAAETIASITEMVDALAKDSDARLQKLEQRDFMSIDLPFWERVKLFLQIKLGLIPIQEYRKMEVDIFRVTDELKEIQKRFGGED